MAGMKKLMIIGGGAAGLAAAVAATDALRAHGVRVETQLEPRKVARQFQYADKAGIQFVALRGEGERAADTVTLKDLRSGEQQTLPMAGAVAHITALVQENRA